MRDGKMMNSGGMKMEMKMKMKMKNEKKRRWWGREVTTMNNVNVNNDNNSEK